MIHIPSLRLLVIHIHYTKGTLRPPPRRTLIKKVFYKQQRHTFVKHTGQIKILETRKDNKSQERSKWKAISNLGVPNANESIIYFIIHNSFVFDELGR